MQSSDVSSPAAEPATDTGYAPARWAFDDEVSRVFDDMLDRSIPQLTVMRAAVSTLARRYRQPGTDVVDLGCSRGGAIADLIGDEAQVNNRYIGVEVAPAMLAAARARFADRIAASDVRIDELDLREGYPRCYASVTLAVFTLMFVPIEHRQRVVHDAYAHTVPGGALIVCEKILGAGHHLANVMIDEYHGFKRANGYTAEDVTRKALALEGVLVPVTARWNEDLLRDAGFASVDCFWRWMNFAGWVAVKAA